MSRPVPRPLAMLVPAAALLSLAGCGGHKDRAADTDTATISFGGLDNTGAGAGDAAGNGAQTVAVSVPGFAAKLNVPGLQLGGADMSIDGIPFRADTKIAGLNITGAAGDGSGGEGHGAVEMRFVDPGAPAEVLAYYRQAAARGGWSEVPPAAGQQFAATKSKTDGVEHLAIQIGAAARGSSGRFLISGT